MRSTTFNRKLKNKEKQLLVCALQIADFYLNIKMDKMLGKANVLTRIRTKYFKLLSEWEELMYKNEIGNKKTYVINKMHRRRIRKLEYFSWKEDFIDEDTGEVVSIERTTIIKIDDVLVDRYEKPIRFDLKTNKLMNEIKI